jgi:8-oxo-dGTP diphosphatase
MTTSRSDTGSEPIRIVAAVVVDARGHTLLVRKRGTAAFMQPGGKIDAGEREGEALAREIREELGCEIADGRRLGTFSAPAANEPGLIVEAILYAVDLVGQVHPAAEIEEAVWHDPGMPSDLVLAPLTRQYVLPLVQAWTTGP